MKLGCVLLMCVALVACSRQNSVSNQGADGATCAPPAKASATNPPAVSHTNASAAAATNAPAPGATAQKEPSTLQTAVDGFTGRTAVNSGRKAQEKIRGLARDRDADMKEVESFGR